MLRTDSKEIPEVKAICLPKLRDSFVSGNKVSYIQDRQCTYNVTLRRFRATIVAVEKQYVLHILSVCLWR